MKISRLILASAFIVLSQGNLSAQVSEEVVDITAPGIQNVNKETTKDRNAREEMISEDGPTTNDTNRETERERPSLKSFGDKERLIENERIRYNKSAGKFERYAQNRNWIVWPDFCLSHSKWAECYTHDAASQTAKQKKIAKSFKKDNPRVSRAGESEADVVTRRVSLVDELEPDVARGNGLKNIPTHHEIGIGAAASKHGANVYEANDSRTVEEGSTVKDNGSVKKPNL